MTDLNPEQVRDRFFVGSRLHQRPFARDEIMGRLRAVELGGLTRLERDLLMSWLAQGEALAAARKAIENASYYLQPNQGESVNVGAASCWLSTAYPHDHPNYLSPEQVVAFGFPDVTALASLSNRSSHRAEVGSPYCRYCGAHPRHWDQGCSNSPTKDTE